MDKVTVVMPMFNSAKFLEIAVRSVSEQTYQNWELILVDDCSQDETLVIARALVKSDDRIKLITHENNKGVAEARNIAIRHAEGRYIAFLDSDDIWKANKLEAQIKEMRQKNISFSFTAYEKIDEKGRKLGVFGVPRRVDYHDLLKTCVIGCLTVVYDMHALGKVYMPLNTKREDFATWLTILKSSRYGFGINTPLAEYRVYSGQSSAKKLSMAGENWRVYRDLEKLNLIQSCYYFSHYAIKGLLRTKSPNIARAFGFLK